jgi:hypothetical protein
MGSYALSANIREGKLQQIPNFIQMGRKEGMCTLNDSLLELLARGIIEPTEAYQKAIGKEELLKRMGAIPSCRSPKGEAWTEEEMLQAAEATHESGNANADGKQSQKFPSPPLIAGDGIDSPEPALVGN